MKPMRWSPDAAVRVPPRHFHRDVSLPKAWTYLEALRA
jgi:hypothetical protein